MEMQAESVYQRLMELDYNRLEELDIQVLQGKQLDRKQRKLYHRLVKFIPNSVDEMREKNVRFLSSIDKNLGAEVA